MERKENEQKGGNKFEGLPVNSSPYTQYKDLEDYKQQGYGTQGHLQPHRGRGAASSVDAPTEAGRDVNPISQLSGINAVNRHSAPN